MLSVLFGKKKKKVLMIDDDQNVLKMYEQILNTNNDVFEVIPVSHKSQFLEHIDKADAVVSDFHMSDVTKLNFEQILDMCSARKKPLLLITGDIYPYYDHQLSKPVSGKMLRLNIEKMLERGYVPSKKRPPRPQAA